MLDQDTPRPRKIQARSLRTAIRRTHGTIVAFARHMGVPRNTVEHVLLGLSTSSRIAEAIAALYGKPAWVIWPQRYAPPVPAPVPNQDQPAA